MRGMVIEVLWLDAAMIEIHLVDHVGEDMISSTSVKSRTKMRVLVCGDRNWEDRDLLFNTLDAFDHTFQIDTVIEGCARGADSLAEEWARTRRIRLEHYPAAWKLYKKAAGPIRNQDMLKARPDMVVAFHDHMDESRGTAHMVKISKRAGVEIVVIGH